MSINQRFKIKEEQQREIYSKFLVLIQQAISKKLSARISTFISDGLPSAIPMPPASRPCVTAQPYNYLDFDKFVARYKESQLLEAFDLICEATELNGDSFREIIKSSVVLMDIITLQCQNDDPFFVTMSVLL